MLHTAIYKRRSLSNFLSVVFYRGSPVWLSSTVTRTLMVTQEVSLTRCCKIVCRNFIVIISKSRQRPEATGAREQVIPEKVRGNSGCAEHATMDFSKREKLGLKSFSRVHLMQPRYRALLFLRPRIRTWRLVPSIGSYGTLTITRTNDH